MGFIVKALDTLLPYRRAAKQQLRSASDGAEMIRNGVKKLRASTRTTDEPAPKDMTEACARFAVAAQRHGRNTPQALQAIELDFARRHAVAVVAALICLSLGMAGIVLIAVSGFWSGVGLSLGLPMGAYATVTALRFGLRRYQVQHRALVPLPVYVSAAGGWFLAIVFGGSKA